MTRESAEPDGIEQLVDQQYLCKRLGLSLPTFARLVKQGRLPPPIDLGPRSRRWRISEVEAALASLGLRAIREE